MSKSLPRLAFVGALALLVHGTTAGNATADAGYSPPASDAQAVSLFKLNRDSKSSFEAKKVKWGKAEIFVSAPMKHVKEAVMDYGNYQSFITRFQKSKLLKKDATGAEAFLQIQILKGSATIWALEKFSAPVPWGKGEMISATMMKGNVDDMQAVWRFRPVDDKHTVVSIELYAAPKIAVPEKLIVNELQDACGEGVLGVRTRAESLYKTAGTVAKN